MTAHLLTALLVATTLVLLLPRRVPAPKVVTEGGVTPSSREDQAVLRRTRPLLAMAAAAGGWALLGGAVGVLVGSVAGAATWIVLGRAEAPSVVRRREQLAEDLPTGIDLLACCLSAGAAPESALVSVSRALGGPVAEELMAVRHRLGLGVDPVEVWRSLAAHPQLGPLGRTVGRAHETGAPIGPAVHRLADELRDRARADVETRARGIEVQATAPLGLCLLPAFALLGVVPMVAGVFGSMRLLQ